MSTQFLRVLHLVNEVVDTGNGIVNVTVDLAIEAATCGDTVAVASSGGGFVPLLEAAGIHHEQIDFRRSPTSAVRALRRLVLDFCPDIVHVHTVAACVIASAVRRIPGGPDFAIVATMHNVYQRSSALMATADMTVGVADTVSQIVRSRRWHSPMVETVVNGVVASPRRVGDPTGELDLGPRSVVTVGAVSQRKGADVLLDAFESLAGTRTDLHLWYVGNLDWEDFVARASSSQFADRIHFAGLSREPGAYLAAATVVAVASRREGLPLSLLEAREAGAAIVATETDGAREGLDLGKAGILVPVGDAAALASALAEMVDSPEFRRSYQELSSTGLERFSVARMSRDYHDRYHQALRFRRSRGRRL